jgi:hypothetical protein
MCDPNVDTHKGNPSRPKGSDGKMEPWPSPYILMLDRGGCTFVKKVSLCFLDVVFGSSRSRLASILSFSNSYRVQPLDTGPKRPAFWCRWRYYR